MVKASSMPVLAMPISSCRQSGHDALTPVHKKHLIADSDDDTDGQAASCHRRRLPLSPSDDESIENWSPRDADSDGDHHDPPKHKPQDSISVISISSDDDVPVTPQKNIRTAKRDPTSSVARRLSARRIISSSEDDDDIPIHSQAKRRISGRRLILSDDDDNSGKAISASRTCHCLRTRSPLLPVTVPPESDSMGQSTSSEGRLSDFIVEDDDAVDASDSSNESDLGPEVSHHALLFQQQGTLPAVTKGPSLSVEDSYHVFFTALVDICTACNPIYISNTVRTSSEKVINHLHTRMKNFVLSGNWSRDFILDINSAPCLSEYPSWDRLDCQVCRRPDRTAAACIHLKGPRYHSESATIFDVYRRSKLSLLLDENDQGPTTYEVGRFCRSRVVLYHRMAHYLLHTVVALRTKSGRLRQHDAESAQADLFRLEADFYSGYEELLDWADQYAVSDSRRSSLQIEFSSGYERLRASDAEVIRWVPELFRESGRFP